MKLNIAILYELNEYGGVQTCVISLIKKLNNEGYVPFLIWDKEPNRELIKENNLKIKFKKINFIIGSTLIKKLPFSVRYFLWPFNSINLSNLKYDFIYSFIPYVYSNTQTSHLIYLSGPPLIPKLDYKPNRFKFIRKIIKLISSKNHSTLKYQNNLKYVINSKFTRDMFFEEYGKKLDVIYPANQFQYNSIDFNLKSRNIITFFSRIADYKRPNLVLELALKYPELNFVIMGGLTKNQNDYLHFLKTEIDNKCLNNISFEINPPDTKVNEILSKTKIYFFPAKDEHFGITTLEAIFKGAIPFVHDSGGQREIVNSSMLKFNDINFYEKFDKLIKLSEADLKSVQKKQFIYSKHFSNEIFQNKMISFLDEK